VYKRVYICLLLFDSECVIVG